MNFFKTAMGLRGSHENPVHPFITFLLVTLLLGFTALTRADITITPLPPYLSETKGTPMVMINLSRDHQLFYKAYNEYTDLDGDGILETQYKHSYKYYGYFDNQRCYDYSTADNRFVPVSKVDPEGYCTAKWNGNFLNWGSMTRMDVVRRILYGGMRSTDSSAVAGSPTTPSLTVLERAHLPTDAHAFAKYYYGNDINKLTPFNPTTTTLTITSGTGTVTTTAAEITLCNASYQNGTEKYSHGAISAPSIRVANGNFALWNANERWQCYWRGEKDQSNDNDPDVSGINASSRNPRAGANGLGTGSAAGQFTARVEVCKTGLSGGFTDDEESRCKLYPIGNYKPIGLLQRYGESTEAAFGLITGSYDKNISGGVLRKNIGSFTDEVDLDDGQFKNTTGIVKTINNLRMYGYNYDDGTYLDSTDNCNFQTIGLTEGDCSSWGNPMGEMFLEALRYFAGSSATSDFNASSPTKDALIGITAATWADPFRASTVADFGARECRANSIINFNASVTSYDGNQWSGASGINGLSATGVENQTNLIGSAEGIHATTKTWSVGNNSVAGEGSNNLCTNKLIGALGSALGICPESPTYQGSYKVAGAAMYAHMNPVRTDLSIPAGNSTAFRITTYSVALATGSPRIVVKVPGQAGKNVVIQPAYRLSKDTGGGGTLVDFKVVTQTDTYGKYMVQWEDSEQGGDYDQDLWGTIEYQVSGSAAAGYKINVSTFIQAESTNQPQGMGYVISGTSGKDGAHFHSGIENFTFNDSTNITVTPITNTNASGGCNNCNVRDAKTTAEYTMVGTPAEVLRDPFWYAAKYGGYDRSAAPSYTAGSVLPRSAWDSKSTGGDAGSDGIPDNYFYAIDPAELERSLRSVFASILKAGGAAPAAATSSRTQAGGYVYVSTHSLKAQTATDDAVASGQFLRYGFQTDGQVASTEDWDAGAKLTAQVASTNGWDTGRKVLSMSDTGQPIAFRWNNLSTSQQTALNKNGNGTVDSKGEQRLQWLRGSSANEVTLTAAVSPSIVSTGGLRKRPTTKLGAIVNSTPWFTGAPNAGYTASQYGGGYPSFRASNTTTSAVFVAANDGMLHAFDATSGNELFSYVPRALYSKLSAITDKDYALNSTIDKVNADGSVIAADMKVGGAWGTYLFGAMGRGAKGVYALNVTQPQNIAESSTATVVKWEFTNANDANFGHVVGRTNAKLNGQPYQTGRMANGRWAAIYGNGYNSTGGNASLFILFADKSSSTTTWVAGTDYIRIDTGTAGLGPNNGLAAPTAIDSDNDGNVDTIYAGDLKGNVWKFNVSSATASDWNVSTTGSVPLYQAKTTVTGSTTVVAQPITTAVQPFPHPKGGYLLVAATGKFLESNDYPQAAPYKNSVYGLYDKPGNTTTIAVGTSSLVEQTITFVSDLRYMSKNTVDYANKPGWFFNLPESSEGIGFNPLYEDARRLGLKSIAPKGSGSNGCRYESNGFDMTLDPISGSPIADLIPGSGDGGVGGGAIGGQTLNSFEFSRGKVSRLASCAPGDATCTPPPTCVAGSPNCRCNPSNPSQCIKCEPGKACREPWKPTTNKCLYSNYHAKGDGGIDTTATDSPCSDGRLTWREVLRIN
jgi:type IV pilus assembly protein PilY1